MKLEEIIIDAKAMENLDKLKSIFLVMECVPHDLIFLMKELKFNDEKSLLTVIYNALCAMKFLHSTGIMHRDIKPSNLLISENLEIQICDFGLSRLIYQDTNLTLNVFSDHKRIIETKSLKSN